MTDRDAILQSLERVRRRWRLRILAEGAVRLALAAVAALLLWALIERSGLGAGAMAALRLGIWGALALGVGWAVWRAVRARADQAAVALYLEEHEPSLRQAVVSAVSTMHEGAGASPALAERLLDAARRAIAAVDEGRRVDARRLRRAGGVLTATTLGTAALVAFGPGALRTSAASLFDPSRAPVAAAPLAVSVTPGDAVVPRGGAQEIAATLAGFGSDVAELVFRSDSAAEWERIPMERDSAGARFLSRLFDLVRPTEYFVEAQGVRSAVHRLDVVDLPAVSGLSALIQFPRYTGLPAETVEEAADLAVLRGSTVTVHARTTRPARAAFLVLSGAEPIPMTAGADGRFSGRFPVTGDGFYRIDLESEDGRRIQGSLDFAIDALEDGAPAVRFAAPGRDTKVTSVEEVTAQIEASDDFGVRALTLHVSVNGGAEQTIVVMDSSVTPRREVSAGHTFFIDEWRLSPGDVVSYFARARDGAGQEAASDLYFFEVRPFDRAYREAEQQGGGGGGGESAEGLSERQRQLVVGTFNVLRDSAAQAEREWRENVTTLAIGQGRLKEDVANLVTRMRQRGLTGGDSTFRVIAAALDSAHGVMQAAEENLGRRRPRAALPEEQRALQHLQRAEAAYRETQVARGNQAGGGGGGAQPNAEELADLFELENDKLRNQYESVQEESAAQAERQVDETLEKLRRLASRQQQENERMERMAEALRNRGGGGGGGGAQRDLARETEEAARQLERLARERNDPTLGESARRLREAAEAMRRAASAGAQGEGQGGQALERLREATRRLEQARSEGRREELARLQARAEELRQRQAEIAEQATSLPRDPAARAERAAALGERKDALARDVEQLEATTDRLARDAGREQPAAARQLAEAAEGLRENRVRDKILFSKNLLRGGSEEYVRAFEEQIGDNLEETARQLGRALGQLGEAGGAREDRALERARELVRGLESLRDRARAARERQERGGEDGRAGERGQPGQTGRAGQQGQQGQQEGARQPGREGQGGEGSPQAAREQQGRPGQMRGDPGGSMSPGDLRQFAREFRARRQAAESLRADLRDLGIDGADLERILSEFRALDRPETFGDLRGLERLEDDLIEGLKNLEFSLWRRFAAEGGPRPAAGASARVPAQYRDLVEEYYRSLARRRAPRPPARSRNRTPRGVVGCCRDRVRIPPCFSCSPRARSPPRRLSSRRSPGWSAPPTAARHPA